ncbi:MAG: hypothetical protein JSW33_16900 [bacterium]|nr:MAG: hypothetical protein JSW33_16900 [bacterium]
MKKYFCFLAWICMILPAYSQYWGERVTEQSFEQSDLYFTSYYLNTFGLHRYREVSVGLVEDPFLNLYLNPAKLPVLTEGNLIHLDFRGDRTSATIADDYYIHPLWDMSQYHAPIYIDPRWYNTTRRDPEPVFSLGFLTYLKDPKNQKLFLGGTYQLIYKQENFYSMPSWIFYNRYGYDVFGNQVGGFNYPVQDRYSGKDEMNHQGHLISAFLGSRINTKLTLGVSMNGVLQSRDGIYQNLQSDEYGSTNDSDWRSLNEIQREQNYHHLDLAVGMDYQVHSNFAIGSKLGYLNGHADQLYQTGYFSEYSYQDRIVPENNGNSFNDSQTRQNWDQDGKNWYGSVNLSKILKDQNQINFYYRYTSSEIDPTNQSQIRDTSFYESSWRGDTLIYESRYQSGLHDHRTGSGDKQIDWHQALLNFRFKLNRTSNLSLGFYYAHKTSIIQSTEPVIVTLFSDHQSNSPYDWNHYLYEDKILDWKYNSKEWSIQIPLIFDFQLNRQWSFTVGINKILRNWEIEEVTVAYFHTRQRLENDSLKTENNFAERYTNPPQKISEDFTDLISKIEVDISPRFQFQLLINPEFEETFRIAQWWLVFRTSL